MNNKPVAWWAKNRNTGIGYVQISKPIRMDKVANEYLPLYTHPAKTLTDEKINELWAESQEDGIAMQQGFTTQQHYFAYLILRKAQDK